MQIKYNITGAKRKELATAISQELNAPVHYLGARSFAYEVGGYRIDKNGMLEGADNPGLVADLEGLHSFRAESAEYDEDTAWAEREMRRLHLENENVPDYSNRGQYGGDDIPIPYEAALGGKVSPYRDYEEPPAYGVPETEDGLTVELPRMGLSDAAVENLRRLVAGKAALIQKALGADSLDIEATNETIRFPWFEHLPEPEVIKAFTTLASCLAKQAKTLQRVNNSSKVVENEKFTFRVFLIRLGFVGDEYKAVRKILLRNLSGNSAFRNGTPHTTTEVVVDE